MGYSDRAADGIELGLGEGTELGQSVSSSEGYNDVKLDISFVLVSLG